MSALRDRFWDVVCTFAWMTYVLLALSIGLLFLTVFSWFNASPSAPSRYITRLNFVVLSVNVVVLLAIVRGCRSRDL